MRALVLIVLLALPGLASAQGQATLVADQVTVTADQRLVAAGHVQVFYDGTTLSAASITYDQAGDLLTIEGPILIVAPDGTIFAADAAQLDPRLENGILRGARLVLNQQLQLAATQISRVDGRYSQLTQVAATSCHVCDGRPPLWEIRASNVVHDAGEQQLYFDNATFRIGGVPVLWVPRMRLPDPSLRRATGLLIPRIRSSNLLGFGLKLPYFITLGPSRDLTLTPYVSAETRTLELRYRQAFGNGTINIAGAFSRDSILRGADRGYLFADGQFAISGGFTLGFNTELSSDAAYLQTYGYSGNDRLDSGLSLVRVRARDLFAATLTTTESLREDEINDSLPPLVAALAYERRFTPDLIGGTLTLRGGFESFLRTDSTPGDAGRDVTGAGLGATWQRDWVLPTGILAGVQGGIDLDAYSLRDDPAYPDPVFRSAPAMAVTLRWPWSRTTGAGVTTVIEPVFSLGWSEIYGGDVPNEDSTLVEFDQANLLALTRFPGQDGREAGWRSSFGVNWTRLDPAGWSSTLTFGRIVRDDGVMGLSAASGLSGVASDWLLAGQINLDGGFALTARTLFDDSLNFAKTDARLDWSNDRLTLNAAYVWLPADADEDRAAPISEWTIDSSFRVNDQWTLSADGRYDVVADRPSRAGFGIGWRNECVTVDLSISRRYTESRSLEPTTDFGLAVNLNGFSAGRAATRTVATCRG